MKKLTNCPNCGEEIIVSKKTLTLFKGIIDCPLCLELIDLSKLLEEMKKCKPS